MLKKIMSGALSVVMLSSCMACNVNAAPLLPPGHVSNLVRASRNFNGWKSTSEKITEKGLIRTIGFNHDFFNSNFCISHLAKYENRGLSTQLFNQLFEAEILSLTEPDDENNTYRTTYKRLLAEHKGNERVELALEEINQFLESCNYITITDNSFDDQSFENAFFGDGALLVAPELKAKLINIRPVVLRKMLRLETLHALCCLVDYPSFMNSQGEHQDAFFNPWLGEVNISFFSYVRLLNCLLLLYSRVNPSLFGANQAPVDSIINMSKFINNDIYQLISNFPDDVPSTELFYIIGSEFNMQFFIFHQDENRMFFDGLMINIIDQLERIL